MSAFFVRRPIVAIVIAILMTLIGGVCILALPIAQYPQIAPPEIQVQTHYTGADALTIEQAVAAPIEQQMSGVDNMASSRPKMGTEVSGCQSAPPVLPTLYYVFCAKLKFIK